MTPKSTPEQTQILTTAIEKIFDGEIEHLSPRINEKIIEVRYHIIKQLYNHEISTQVAKHKSKQDNHNDKHSMNVDRPETNTQLEPQTAAISKECSQDIPITDTIHSEFEASTKAYEQTVTSQSTQLDDWLKPLSKSDLTHLKRIREKTITTTAHSPYSVLQKTPIVNLCILGGFIVSLIALMSITIMVQPTPLPIATNPLDKNSSTTDVVSQQMGIGIHPQEKRTHLTETEFYSWVGTTGFKLVTQHHNNTDHAAALLEGAPTLDKSEQQLINITYHWFQTLSEQKKRQLQSAWERSIKP